MYVLILELTFKFYIFEILLFLRTSILTITF